MALKSKLYQVDKQLPRRTRKDDHLGLTREHDANNRTIGLQSLSKLKLPISLISQFCKNNISMNIFIEFVDIQVFAN